MKSINKIKASALYFTIMAMVLVSALVSAFVLWSVYFNVKNHQDFNKIKLAQLLNDSEGIINYYYDNLSTAPFKTSIYNEGDTVVLTKKPYGIFDLLTFKVNIGNLESFKDYISAYVTNFDSTALYIGNSNQPLKFVGDVEINGDVYLPEKGAERAYVEGKSFTGDKFFEGNQKLSNQFPLLDSKLLDRLNFIFTSLPENIFDTIVNYSTISIDTCLLNKGKLGLIIMDNSNFFQKKLIGKWIILSSNEIFISNYYSTSGQVFIANQIEVESGFKGEVQLFANQNILINDNVTLNYPSFLFLKTANFKNAQLTIEPNCKVLGGVFLISDNQDISNQSLLQLKNNTLVVGQVYCNTFLQLSGTVFGNVYANKLYLKTNSSVYENLIMDCKINAYKKDKQLLTLPIHNSGKYEIIDWE